MIYTHLIQSFQLAPQVARGGLTDPILESISRDVNNKMKTIEKIRKIRRTLDEEHRQGGCYVLRVFREEINKYEPQYLWRSRLFSEIDYLLAEIITQDIPLPECEDVEDQSLSIGWGELVKLGDLIDNPGCIILSDMDNLLTFDDEEIESIQICGACRGMGTEDYDRPFPT